MAIISLLENNNKKALDYAKTSCLFQANRGTHNLTVLAICYSKAGMEDLYNSTIAELKAAAAQSGDDYDTSAEDVHSGAKTVADVFAAQQEVNAYAGG